MLCGIHGPVAVIAQNQSGFYVIRQLLDERNLDR